jgi:hypothetical protein
LVLEAKAERGKARPSPHSLRCTVRARKGTEIEEAPGSSIHRLGTTCGLSPPERGISGRKAPRVQRIASSLRGEVCEAALSTDRASGRPGRTHEISRVRWRTVHHPGDSSRGESGSATRGVRATSGWGEASTASHRGWRVPVEERASANRHQRPLTRETSAPRSSSCSGQTGMQEERTADRPSGGEPTKVRAPYAKPGVDRPMVVLADRLVGRSRRTTRGLERTGAMSS